MALNSIKKANKKFKREHRRNAVRQGIRRSEQDLQRSQRAAMQRQREETKAKLTKEG